MTDFEKLSATEKRILQLIVGDPTASQTAIAKKLKLTRQHVSSLLNSAPLRTATNSDVVKAARVLLEFRMRDLPEKPRLPERYVVRIHEDGIIHQERQEWDGLVS